MVIASDLSRQNGRQWRDTATDASNNRLSEVISIATLYFFTQGLLFQGHGLSSPNGKMTLGKK